jgi:hypothetical protein
MQMTDDRAKIQDPNSNIQSTTNKEIISLPPVSIGPAFCSSYVLALSAIGRRRPIIGHRIGLDLTKRETRIENINVKIRVKNCHMTMTQDDA